MKTHLQGFGLENFRVFKEYTWFDFAAITVLTGPNNSGKSSLNKALLLMKDSLSGSSQATNVVKDDRFSFNFSKFKGLLTLKTAVTTGGHPEHLAFTVLLLPCSRWFTKRLFLRMGNFTQKDIEGVLKFELFFEDGQILFYERTDLNIFFDLNIFLRYINYDMDIDEEERNYMEYDPFDPITKLNLSKALTELKDHKEEKFATNNYDYESDFPFFPPSILDKYDELNPSILLKSYFNQNTFPGSLLTHIDTTLRFYGITTTLSKFEYIDFLPFIKGHQQRSYRGYEDDILNTLIQNLPKKLEVSYMNFLKKWCDAFNLNGEIAWKVDTNLNVNYITIGKKSLVDYGFGISQLAAVLLKILSSITNWQWSNGAPILILEEPEANLHPNFQSKLADMLVDAAETFHLQFIVETHSEYLIRKLQYLTAKKTIKPEDTVIYYFNDPNHVPTGEKQVKKIEIQEDGSLSGDFGSGFFDEATNWELELLRLKKHKNRQN